MTNLGPESERQIAHVDMGFCGDGQMEGELLHTQAEVDDLARQGFTVVDVEAGTVARPVVDIEPGQTV